MDDRCFREWARLMHRRSDDLIEDAMIAATAQVYGLLLVTRNTRDFAALGLKTLNPFAPGASYHIPSARGSQSESCGT